MKPGVRFLGVTDEGGYCLFGDESHDLRILRFELFQIPQHNIIDNHQKGHGNYRFGQILSL